MSNTACPAALALLALAAGPAAAGELAIEVHAGYFEMAAERLGGAPADGRNDTYGYGLVRPANALPGLGIDVGPKR